MDRSGHERFQRSGQGLNSQLFLGTRHSQQPRSRPLVGCLIHGRSPFRHRFPRLGEMVSTPGELFPTPGDHFPSPRHEIPRSGEFSPKAGDCFPRRGDSLARSGAAGAGGRRGLGRPICIVSRQRWTVSRQRNYFPKARDCFPRSGDSFPRCRDGFPKAGELISRSGAGFFEKKGPWAAEAGRRGKGWQGGCYGRRWVRAVVARPDRQN